MKKILLMLALLLPLPVLSMTPEEEQKILAQYPDITTKMTLQRASEHVYFVQGKAGIATDNEGFISNAGVVITSDGIVVFDALGSPSLAKRLVQLVREVSPLPFKKLVLSHYHADHIYGIQLFKELGAEVIAPYGIHEYLASPAAKERLEERRFSLEPWVNENTRLVDPDQLLKENAQFSMGGVDFSINLLGAAHSVADLAMYVEPDSVLLSGDIIFEGRVPFVGNANTKTWLETLTQLQTQNVKALIPGHGPLAKEPQEAIAMTRDYLALLRDKLGAAVDDFVPFAEIYDTIEWGEYKNLPAFEEANRRNAYQVYLSLEAEALGQ